MRFMILAQPRSRTKWLSEYLSHDGTRCGHDLILGCRSVDEYIDKLHRYDGTVETSGILGFPLWREYFPAAQFILIHRTILSIGRSFETKGLVPDWAFLYMQEFLMEQIPYVPFFTFESLNQCKVRKQLCNLVGNMFSPDWDIHMDRKIEIDIAERKAYIDLHQSDFALFCSDVCHCIVLSENSKNA